jgi:succinate dehydrogenase/fumarate reductase flavoprotein subunit
LAVDKLKGRRIEMSDQKRLNRRDFLKGAATAGAGLAGAGALGATPLAAQVANPVPTPQYGRPGIDDVPVAATAVPTPTSAPAAGPAYEGALPTTWAYETDVLVIGLGFAGLCATARALEQKVAVMAIDKLPRGPWAPGGNMLIAGGSIHLGVSLATPRDLLAAQLKEKTADMIPPHMLDACVDNAPGALAWYVQKGAQFEEAAPLYRQQKPTLPPPVWGRIKPGGIQDAANYGAAQNCLKLEKFITDNGGKLLYVTKALDLLTDSNGQVVGVKCQGNNGRFYIKAKAVVLCSGGFEKNSEMLLKYIGPRADEVIAYTGPGGTGDGLLMAEKLGAGLRSMNHAAFSHYYSVDCYWKPDVVGAFLEAPAGQGIIVDQDGHRFFDESLGTRIGGSIMAKTTIYIRRWIIIDDQIRQMAAVKPKIDDLVEFGGTILTADTIAELATKAGIGPRLSLTINEFNTAVDAGKVKELEVPRNANANKLSKPPFYAIPFVPGIVATYGGLTVSPRAEVLDRDKQPIPGLYAAGIIMEGSISGGIENSAGAYAGCLAACLIFGKLSAESAAAYARKG